MAFLLHGNILKNYLVENEFFKRPSGDLVFLKIYLILKMCNLHSGTKILSKITTPNLIDNDYKDINVTKQIN